MLNSSPVEPPGPIEANQEPGPESSVRLDSDWMVLGSLFTARGQERRGGTR